MPFDSPDLNLGALLGDIEVGKVQLPDFQREWKWDDPRIASLLATITLGYPVGVVMMLETGGADTSTAPSNGATEAAFHAAMVDAYRRAKDEAGYPGTGFLRMVSERGGMAAARQLLHASSVSDGFTALWERKRLDLTMEALVLRPEFGALFTAEELAAARHRLEQYGYSPG